MSTSGRPHRTTSVDQDATASAAATSTGAAHASVAGPASPAHGQSSSSQAENISYSAERIIGNGSFGVVFEAKVVETNEVVAIKKVLQDKRFKNRELQIMRQLVKDPHTNIVALKHCFYSQVRSVFNENFVALMKLDLCGTTGPAYVKLAPGLRLSLSLYHPETGELIVYCATGFRTSL